MGGTLILFETDEDQGRPGLYRLRKHFLPARDLVLRVAGEPVRWREGERVEMNWSGKYARDAFMAVLADAGLAPVARYVATDERFIMVLAAAAHHPASR